MVKLVQWAMVGMGPQATAPLAYWPARETAPRGLSPRRACQRGCVVTKEIRSSAPGRHLTRLNSGEEGGGDWKSEGPIPAMISGNAAVAQGRRFEIADQRAMTRHRTDVFMAT
jgi:hypothetical protein